MNILILSGSPRKKGLVSQMLDIMREEAEKRGDEVETIRTNDLNIKPCIGCMACRTKEKCVALRPSRLWHDARYPTIPRASYEGQEMHPTQHLHYSLALEYLVQSVTWCHSCPSRDMPLFRLQDCCHNRAWRYCNASSAIGKRQAEMP